MPYLRIISDKVDRSCKEILPDENPWKTAAEEPHAPYIGAPDSSTLKTNTLPMYLHDIITKAPKVYRKPTTPPTEKSRIPRKGTNKTNKAGDPQKVQSASIRNSLLGSVLLISVLVSWL